MTSFVPLRNQVKLTTSHGFGCGRSQLPAEWVVLHGPLYEVSGWSQLPAEWLVSHGPRQGLGPDAGGPDAGGAAGGAFSVPVQAPGPPPSPGAQPAEPRRPLGSLVVT